MPQSLQNRAEVVVGLCVLWIQVQHLPEMFRRERVILLRIGNKPEIVVRVGMTGIQCQGLAEGISSSVEFAECSTGSS